MFLFLFHPLLSSLYLTSSTLSPSSSAVHSGLFSVVLCISPSVLSLSLPVSLSLSLSFSLSLIQEIPLHHLACRDEFRPFQDNSLMRLSVDDLPVCLSPQSTRMHVDLYFYVCVCVCVCCVYECVLSATDYDTSDGSCPRWKLSLPRIDSTQAAVTSGR